MFVRRVVLGLAPVMIGATALAGCQGVPDDKLIDFGDDDGAAETGVGDDGPNFPTAPICDPIRQDCEPDEKCTALRSGDVQDRYNCVPNDGGLAEGQNCSAAPSSGQDGCQAGLVCVTGDFGLSDGVCLELCVNDFQCDAGTCIQDVGTGVRHCAPDCSPLAIDCPQPRQRCLSTDSGFACRYPGEGDVAGALEGCDSFSGINCGEGLVCVQAGVLVGCDAAFCCTPVCDLEGSGDPCAGATSCTEFQSTGPANVGICVVPQ